MLRHFAIHRRLQTVRRAPAVWVLLLGVLAMVRLPTPPTWADPSAQAMNSPLSNSPLKQPTQTSLPTVNNPAAISPLLISEVMADPDADDDEQAEWIEIVNRTDSAIDLKEWRLVNLSDSAIRFQLSLIVPPRGYVVLARQGDPAQNGGIQPAFIYRDFVVANAMEHLQLIDPNGQVVDSVTWGDGARPAAPVGASWERTAVDPTADWTVADWVVAHTAWPGSAGDRGSPGAPYSPPPPPTATPTVSPSATLPPTATPPPATPPRLYLSELMADPAAAPDETGEWIELYNGDAQRVNLAGWVLADDDNDQVVLGERWIEPDAYLVLGRNSDAAQNGGVLMQGTYTDLTLANEADELRLLTPWGVEVDRVAWGPDSSSRLAIQAGASLERTGFNGDSWVTALTAWPGSAGDLGSPGTAYTAPPTPTPTATLPAQPPRLYLSELMIDPAAVPDDAGEWIELFNADAAPVDLTGWHLVDQHGGRHPISGGTLAPQGYTVVARRDDPAQNGGVVVAATYSGLQLTNDGGTLVLVAPWGAEIDRMTWGASGPAPLRGASLERTGFDVPFDGSTAGANVWAAAHAMWPGSAGDLGSPNRGYVSPPAPTPTATPPPSVWPLAPQASPLQIDQVFGTGSDDEYIVLINQSNVAVTLDGWRVGDAEIPGKGEGMVRLPDGVTLAPGARYVLAREAAAFRARWGFAPHAAWTAGDQVGGDNVPRLMPEPQLGTRAIALNNQGDEVLLLDPAGHLADVLAYGDAAYTMLGLHGQLPTAQGQAFFRAPGASFPLVRDLRHRFLRSTPDPATTYTLPGAHAHAPVAVDDNMAAWWGTLGAVSTFSPDGIAPPHVLLAEAAGLGLDFVAIADVDPVPDAPVQAQTHSAVTALPAWRWQSPAGPSAIVYGAPRATPLSWGDLFDHLARTNGSAQLPAPTTPVDVHTPLFTADALYAPGGLGELYARWAEAKLPLLPAGNRNPPVRGAEDTSLRYTGLVAPDASANALLAAMAAGRGWLTSSPDLWLTLHSTGDSANNSADDRWMGSTIAPSNQITLSLTFGDRRGEPVAVALWQDDHIVRQLDLPPADGRWQVRVPAVPGSFLYVVATQRDGDFAVTAPLYVVPAAGGAVLINEALPAPDADHNGDGARNTDDEFIELYNPGSAPLTLTGVQLHDAGDAGHRFTFGPGRFIGAGEYLVLWRDETGLSLNDDGDGLWLLDDAGTQIDHVAWGTATRGHAYGRLLGSDDQPGDWRRDLEPTPGRANAAIPVEPPRPPREPDFDPVDVADPRSPVFGQATGSPGSLALGKLRGLYTPVEFRGQVTVPPGLFNSAIYVAEATDAIGMNGDGVPGTIAGLGVQVYLNGGDFIPMQEGDWVLVRGQLRSFRGEMEIQLDEPGRAWRIGPGDPLLPLPVHASEIGESLEGRLVTFDGVITGWQGDSLYMVDVSMADAVQEAAAQDTKFEAATPVRVTVRSSLDWRRPYVHVGEQYRVVGVVSQFGTKSPWNDGYRVLPRFESDVVKLNDAPTR